MNAIFSRFNARITPRGRGMLILLAIVFLFAIATGEDVLYRVSYFLTLIVLGSYVCVRLKLWRLDMQMQGKSYGVQVGDTLKWYVYVYNNSPLPTGWVEIAPMSDMPTTVSGVATSVGARKQEHVEMQVLCHSRGVYSIGPLLARTHDPLGLFQAQRVGGNPVKVVVQPPIVPLPYFRLPKEGKSGEESMRYRSQIRTPNVATIREYTHGDGLNQIHWLSTARSGQLMSKEFDSGGGGDVWIVLDLEQGVHHSQGANRTDEYAVAIAASLAQLAVREEHSVGLIAYGDREYLLPLGGGSPQMSRVLETLILSKTEGVNSLDEVLVMNAGQFSKSASLLIVTSSTRTEWISVLQKLQGRGLNVVVVLIDATTFGGEHPLDENVVKLVSAGIPAYVVHKGDHVADALCRPIILDDLPLYKRNGKPKQMVASGT